MSEAVTVADLAVQSARAKLSRRGETRPEHWFEQIHYWTRVRAEWLEAGAVGIGPQMPEQPMSEQEWGAFKATKLS